MRLATIWCAIVFGLWVTALGALRVHRSPNPFAAVFGLVQFIAGILIILLTGAALVFAADNPGGSGGAPQSEMENALVWTALAAVGGLGLFVLGIVKWIAGVARQLALVETAADRADATAAGAMGKCELLGTDFHNHRVATAARVAEINAKADNAAQAIILAENRLAKAMDDFGGRLDKIVERLDRVLEYPNAQRRD